MTVLLLNYGIGKHLILFMHNSGISCFFGIYIYQTLLPFQIPFYDISFILKVLGSKILDTQKFKHSLMFIFKTLILCIYLPKVLTLFSLF